jgi:tRNA A37 threonylcarbamoyladenosine dehydratase
MAKMELSDDDMQFLIDALDRLYSDKCAALATAQREHMPFSARDFGMPQIYALRVRVADLYETS